MMMSRLLFVTICLGLAAACLAQDVPANLLANPSFETVREGSAVEWSSTLPSAVALREDGGHGGQRYLRVTDPDGKTGINVESTRLPCRPGGQYSASAWFRTADKCSPGVYLNLYDDVGTRVHSLYSRATGPAKGWVQTTVQTEAPRNANTVSVTLYAYIGDTGVFDVDEVTMTVTGGGEPGTGGIPAATPGTKEAVTIDSRRELFIDSYLVDNLSGTARRRMHNPQFRQPVLQLDAPCEGTVSAYFAVMRVEGKIRLYYRGQGSEGKPETTCVAESEDGINFTRPKVGIFEWEGNKDNNIVWLGEGNHNFTPFLDPNPAAPPEQRFKALASVGPKGQLAPFVSADGFAWKRLRDEPVITKGAFDSQNLAFWDPLRKLYVEYHRGFRDGVRDIMTSTSADFLTWTEPQWLDYGEAPAEHLYTNAITPYFRAPHLYVGLPNRYVPGRKKIATHKEDGVDDALLMSSRDGLHFERWREAFLRPTLDDENWTDRNNYVAWGIVPLNEREIAIYSTDHYRHPTARVVLNTIRTDGFASLYADAEGGQALTRPFTFSGKRLEVNYATSAAGSLRFELCDTTGKALPGFSMADSELLYGNELAHTVAWRGGTDVSALAGQTVRLRINLKDADLFSVMFCP
ncbi:MAG: hypothetical protein ABFD94_03770 [Armatimonadia bacterium]